LVTRRYPIGVEVIQSTDGPRRVHARVWAPDHTSIDFVSEPSGTFTPLTPERNGYFSGFVEPDPSGLYPFRIDGGQNLYPDPASRYQPDGPHGPSMLVDASRYEWSDGAWRGVQIEGQVIYELHVGTFTKGGTFRAAIDRLPDLVDLGATIIEV